jgi:hypothetical protein
MDAFREPTPEEAKLLALQFMGQNIGDIKEINKNVVGRSNNLNGNIINVEKVLSTLPSSGRPRPQYAPQQVQQVPVQPPIQQETITSAPVMDLLQKINNNLETVVRLLEK